MHTKGEWNAEYNPEFCNSMDFPYIVLVPCKGANHPNVVGSKMSKANARRIVTCVNSHDDLLEACKEALETELVLMDNQSHFRSGKLIEQLQQVISKAEKG